MSKLVIGSVVNWIDSGDLANRYESSMGSFTKRVETAVNKRTSTYELETIHVQFQFACAGMPDAAIGIRIGRFSKKHKDIGADIEISEEDLSKLSAESEQHKVFMAKLLQALKAIHEKLSGRVTNDVSELLLCLQRLE